MAEWRELRTDDGASFDDEVRDRRRRAVAPGHLGDHTRPWSPASRRRCPSPLSDGDRARAASTWRSSPARRMRDIKLDTRVHRLVHQLADRRPARGRRGGQGPQGVPEPARDGGARLPAGGHRRPSRRAWTRCSSEAGFDWRSAGCSMCLGMNPDILAARRALRVHLEPQLRGPPGHAAGAPTSCSPKMAAAAALEGHFVDIRDWS
ncbi:MAG: hypothetical protein WKF40_09535 [Thermoleophilaceae bacterium]